MRNLLSRRHFDTTSRIYIMMLWCLPFLIWADKVTERRSGVLAPLDESTFLEVRGGKMVDHVVTSRLFLVRKNKDDFEIASWQRNYKVYLELGLEEIPAVGVFSGASIVEGRMENGVVVAVVEYNRAHYLVAMLVEELKRTKPVLLEAGDDAENEEGDKKILNFSRQGNHIQVSMINKVEVRLGIEE